MNERRRAADVLRQARDILTQRLTEHIVEHAESIIDDARGDSYLSEIDATYDAMGLRLVHVSQMLNHLPDEPMSSEPHVATSPIPEEMVDEHFVGHSDPPAEVAYATAVFPGLALPSPSTTSSPPSSLAPISFQTFASQIQAGQLDEASEVLAQLLDVSPLRAKACARTFAERLASEPGFLLKAMGLRRELAAGAYNSAIYLLYECFGLRGLEAVAAIGALRAKLLDR